MRDTDHLLEIGSTNGYQWLVSTNRKLEVLQCCPHAVLGKHLAITSFDSGPLEVTDQLRSDGWASRGGIAYSPAIQRVDMVPQAYFSELYVFGAPMDLGALVDPKTNIFESVVQEGQVPSSTTISAFMTQSTPSLLTSFGNSLAG
jgi:hypothetical protein